MLSTRSQVVNQLGVESRQPARSSTLFIFKPPLCTAQRQSPIVPASSPLCPLVLCCPTHPPSTSIHPPLVEHPSLAANHFWASGLALAHSGNHAHLYPLSAHPVPPPIHSQPALSAVGRCEPSLLFSLFYSILFIPSGLRRTLGLEPRALTCFSLFAVWPAVQSLNLASHAYDKSSHTALLYIAIGELPLPWPAAICFLRYLFGFLFLPALCCPSASPPRLCPRRPPYIISKTLPAVSALPSYRLEPLLVVLFTACPAAVKHWISWVPQLLPASTPSCLSSAWLLSR